jgi:hypothetical protein
MSGPNIYNSGGRQMLPNNAANGQVPVWNSALKKWVAANQEGGDVTAAGENNFTGNNFFANDVYIGTDSTGDDSKKVATLGNLRNLASLTADEQVFLGQGNRFEYPIYIGAYTAENQVQTWQQVNDTIALAISVKADTSVLSNYAAKASANTFTANQTINANLAVGGTFTAIARTHVRGDGTNPIARFESAAGQNILTVRESDHTILFGVGVGSLFPQIGLQTLNNPTSFATGNGQGFGYKSNFNMDWPAPMHSFYGENQIYNKVTLNNGPAGIAAFNGTFGISNVAASTFDYRMLNVNYTINNTVASNRTATGIFLNATETNLNGMAHNLLDLQIGGGSRFSVRNDGYVTASSAIQATTFLQGNALRFTATGRIQPASDGVFTFSNNAVTSFDRIQLGGTTNTFPAIKRSGTKIDFILADASDFCDISARGILANSLIRCASSTVTTASIQIPAGATPTAPVDGDIWNGGDGRLYIRIGGVTRYFSVI